MNSIACIMHLFFDRLIPLGIRFLFSSDISTFLNHKAGVVKTVKNLKCIMPIQCCILKRAANCIPCRPKSVCIEKENNDKFKQLIIILSKGNKVVTNSESIKNYQRYMISIDILY